MRVAVFFYVAVGIALIVFGCVLQNPPKSLAPALFVAAGSLNLFAALAGFWGSYNKKRILMVFIIFGAISTIIQIAFVISLFTMFDKMVNKVAEPSANNPDQQKKHDDTAKQLNIMRWVSLGFIFVELLTIILAVLLKWVIRGDDEAYRGFDDDVNEARQLNMTNLRSDVEKASKGKERAYDKIKEKMAAKYGALTQGGDWRSKTKLSWQPK